MNIEGNLYITYLANMGIHRVVGVRPASMSRKERDKRDKNGRNSGYVNKVSFNDCLLKHIDEINNSDSCEEKQPKRLLK